MKRESDWKYVNHARVHASAQSFDRCEIVEYSSDNETVFGSSRKLGGAAEHLIDGSENPICRLSFEF